LAATNEGQKGGAFFPNSAPTGRARSKLILLVNLLWSAQSNCGDSGRKPGRMICGIDEKDMVLRP
jgi:hypothetical protein